MKISIRLAKNSDLNDYSDLLQKAYKAAYTDESIGLTKDCFSKKIFASPDIQKYLKSHLIINNRQKTWFAFINSQMIGAITCISKSKKEVELTGFYVALKYQDRGIGKKLYRLVVDFANRKDLVLDIYAHNTKTIEMYKRWGWKLDSTRGNKGYFFRHWPEWSKGLQAKCMYMRFTDYK